MSLKTRAPIIGLMLAMAVGSANAEADLIDLGSFDDGLGGMIDLIYDDDLNITWLGNANFGAGSLFDDGPDTTDGEMTWQSAVDWAASLTVGGFTDWRLPNTTQPDATCAGVTGDVPPQGFGQDCTGSEMGHLFYDELGGTVNADILTSSDPDLALFGNLRADGYWSGTEFLFIDPSEGSFAWTFQFGGGIQGVDPKSHDNDFAAWAVRSGDVAIVPEPSTLALFVTGIAGLGFMMRRRRSYARA